MIPIHVISVFHNYILLDDIIKNSNETNMFTADDVRLTPLILASCNSMEDEKECFSTAALRRDKTVESLIQKGADVNLCTDDGISPLWTACYEGHENTAQLLLNNGAEVNLCTDDGISPLWTACENGHENTAQLLLNNGAEVNLCTKEGRSPLWAACYNGHESTAQLLLNNGAEVN